MSIYMTQSLKKLSPGSSSSAHKLLRKREWYNNMDNSKKTVVLDKVRDYTRDMRISAPESMQNTPTNAQHTGCTINNPDMLYYTLPASNNHTNVRTHT